LSQSDALCSGDYYSVVNSNPGGSPTCVPLSTDSTDSISFATGTRNGNTQDGIQYSAADTTDYVSNCDSFTTKVDLVCDSNITTPLNVTVATFDNSECTFYTEVRGAGACEVLSINGLWEFFDQYKDFFGIVYIVLGIFMTFFGRKLFLAAVFICALIITVFGILLLCYGTFLSTNDEEWVGWLMLSISIVLGILAGLLLVKYSKFAAAVVGAWAGYILGLFINDLALWPIGSSWVFWLVNIGCAVACAIAAFIFFNPAVILGTAFIGSYALMRGIGMYAGGFQNEYTIVSEIQSGAVDNIEWTTYAYLAGWIVVFIIGSILQFKMFNRMNEEEKKHPYNRLQ